MFGSITARAGVSYRGISATNASQPIPPVAAIKAIPPEKRDRPRQILYGSRGMFVDRVA